MDVKVCKLEKIKLLTEDREVNVGIDTIEPILPKYGKMGDACMDVYPICAEVDEEKDRIIYHTGLAFALPFVPENISEDTIAYVPTEMSIRPRSNLTKSNWYIPNAPGTLDFGYRGELLIIFKNRTSSDILHLLRIIVNNIAMEDTAREVFNDVLFKLKEDINTLPYNCDGKDRCCQIIVRGRQNIFWEEVSSVEELGDTDRGAGGFGSTGGAVK